MNDLNVQLLQKQHTWGDLRSYLIETETAQGRDAKHQQTKNLLGTLNLFMEHLGASDESEINAAWIKDFKATRTAFEKGLLDKGLASKTVSNHKSQLNKLLTLYSGLAVNLRSDTRVADLPAALQVRIATNGFSSPNAFAKHIAQLANIPPTTVLTWILGNSTPRNSEKNRLAIEQMEITLVLTPGILIHLYFKGKPKKAQKTKHGNKMSFIQCLINVHPNRTLKFRDAPQHLKDEWQEFFDFKSNLFYYGPLKRGKSRWKLKPLEKVIRCKNNQATYSRDGKVAASASARWSGFSSYFGFLLLPKNPREILTAEDLKSIPEEHHGLAYRAFTGMGLKPEEIRLVDLINLKYLPEFFAYRAAVSDSARSPWHSVTDIKALVAHRIGFLRQQPDLAHHLNVDRAKWDAYCDEVFDFLTDVKGTAEAAPKSRDPEEPIDEILKLNNPLESVFELEESMQHDEPVAINSEYAIWFRDLLLIKLMRSNPLRINNWSTLDLWRDTPGDGKGTVRRAVQGAWSFHIPKEDFKNEKGAKAENYLVDIPKSLWPYLDRYLDLRPLINKDPEAKYLFVTEMYGSQEPVSPTTLGTNIANRSEYYTGYRYGPHAMRHIVATAWLKQHPNDFLAVAHLLHDQLETVMKHYAHLQVQDSLTKYGDWLEELEAQGGAHGV